MANLYNEALRGTKAGWEENQQRIKAGRSIPRWYYVAFPLASTATLLIFTVFSYWLGYQIVKEILTTGTFDALPRTKEKKRETS